VALEAFKEPGELRSLQELQLRVGDEDDAGACDKSCLPLVLQAIGRVPFRDLVVELVDDGLIVWLLSNFVGGEA